MVEVPWETLSNGFVWSVRNHRLCPLLLVACNLVLDALAVSAMDRVREEMEQVDVGTNLARAHFPSLMNKTRT